MKYICYIVISFLCLIGTNLKVVAGTNMCVGVQTKMAAKAGKSERTDVKAKENGKEVVLRVNGFAITKNEYLRNVNMMVALYSNRNTRAAAKQFKKLRIKTCQSYYRPLAQRLIIETLVETNKAFIATEESLAKIRRQYQKSFAPRGKNFDQLHEIVEKLGYADIFDRNIKFDAALDNYFSTVFSNELVVTEGDIKKVRRNVLACNDQANATNKLNEALGKSLVARARSGEDFGKLANEYSMEEDKPDGGALGELCEIDFSDESPMVWQELNRLPVGGVSDLLLLSDGYAIYKVDARVSANDSASGSRGLKLRRIFLRRAYIFPDQTDEEFRADVIREKHQQFYCRFLKAMGRRSKIEFPMSSGVFKQLSNQMKGGKK